MADLLLVLDAQIGRGDRLAVHVERFVVNPGCAISSCLMTLLEILMLMMNKFFFLDQTRNFPSLFKS
jgi:hypothetical protein